MSLVREKDRGEINLHFSTKCNYKFIYVHVYVTLLHVLIFSNRDDRKKEMDIIIRRIIIRRCIYFI